jgi:hypothetical protein
LYAYVNYAKFGTLISVPIQKQDILAKLSPQRRSVLASTGNSLFGLDYLPTNLLQYFRPDAIGFRHTFPWVTFGHRPFVFGGVVFDNIESSASVTATSCFLVALAVLGVIAAIKAARGAASDRAEVTAAFDTPEGALPTASVFRTPLVSAALAIPSTLAIAVLFQRYEGDFVPAIVLAATVGFAWIGVLLIHSRRWVRALVIAAAVVLAIWSVWSTLSLTLIYQREYSAFQDPAVRAAFFNFQLDVNDALGLGPPKVRHGSKLPAIKPRQVGAPNAPHGQIFEVGNCDGVYIATGQSWEPIEGLRLDQSHWKVRFDRAAPGTREPLFSAGTGFHHIVWIHWVDDSHVLFEYEWTGAPFSMRTSTKPWHVVVGRTYELAVHVDPSVPSIEFRNGHHLLFRTRAGLSPSDPTTRLGRQPDASRGDKKFHGSIAVRRITPICNRLNQ